MYICYQWTCIANDKKYVGITKNTLDSRWKRHCYEANNGSLLFHKAIREAGLKLNIAYGTLYNRIKNTNGNFDNYRLMSTTL